MPIYAEQPRPAIRPASTRVAELDGLRAFAIIPVILHHCYPYDPAWLGFFGQSGWMGVDLFFVLSGYLITGILLRTIDNPHYYKNFIKRRSLRIFPLYYLCLLLFTIAASVAGGPEWAEMKKWGIGWLVVYLGNFRSVFANWLPPIFSFAPLWSLQVEEQFYLLYPFAVKWLSVAGLQRLLVACAITAPILRTAFLLTIPDNVAARYVFLFSRMDGLALGGLVAILVQKPAALWPSRSLVRTSSVLLGLATFALYSHAWLTRPSDTSAEPIMSSVGYSIIALTAAAVLTLVVLYPPERLAAVLRWRPLTYTGEIAYGLYLLHAPASWLARKLVVKVSGILLPGHSWGSMPVTLLASFVAASISWRIFESPILALKEKFTQH